MPDKVSGYDQTKPENEVEEPEIPHSQNYDGAADSGDPTIPQPNSRSKIREAIRSVYGPRPTVAPPPEEPPATVEKYEPDPEEEARAATRLIKAQVDGMVTEARELAHNGQKEKALKILSQAVRIDPDHSMAWTWLGGLMIERNPERALYCLERAYALDPTNVRAEKGLIYINQILYPAKTEEPVEELDESVPDSRAMVLVDEDEQALANAPDPRSIKIGIEEALGVWRESYPFVHPEDLPIGGAKVGKRRRPLLKRKPKKARTGKGRNLKLSIYLTLFLVGLSFLGMWVLVANPRFEAPAPTPTALPTPSPLPTPSADDLYGVKLRGQVEKYTGFTGRIRELYKQFNSGTLRWEDLRKGYRDLQGAIKDQKKRVDELAGPTSPQLLTVYKELQEISVLSITSINFMVSGTENISDEDLNEGTRGFNRVNGLLAEIIKQLDAVAPLPTAIPELISTPSITPAGTADSTAVTTPNPGTVTPGATPTIATTPTPTVTNTPAP